MWTRREAAAGPSPSPPGAARAPPASAALRPTPVAPRSVPRVGCSEAGARGSPSPLPAQRRHVVVGSRTSRRRRAGTGRCVRPRALSLEPGVLASFPPRGLRRKARSRRPLICPQKRGSSSETPHIQVHFRNELQNRVGPTGAHVHVRLSPRPLCGDDAFQPRQPGGALSVVLPERGWIYWPPTCSDTVGSQHTFGESREGSTPLSKPTLFTRVGPAEKAPGLLEES